MVRMRGLEPPASWPPATRSSQTELHSDVRPRHGKPWAKGGDGESPEARTRNLRGKNPLHHRCASDPLLRSHGQSQSSAWSFSVDSNHGSRRMRPLPCHLATERWSQPRDSNPIPHPYQGCALPDVLGRLGESDETRTRIVGGLKDRWSPLTVTDPWCGKNKSSPAW